MLTTRRAINRLSGRVDAAATTRDVVLDRSRWEPVEQEMIAETAWLSPADIRALPDPVFPENFADLVDYLKEAPRA